MLQAKLNQAKPVMKTDVTVAGLTVTMRWLSTTTQEQQRYKQTNSSIIKSQVSVKTRIRQSFTKAKKLYLYNTPTKRNHSITNNSRIKKENYHQ